MLIFTKHVEIQMVSRDIPIEIVRDTVETPDQKIPAPQGRHVCQSQYFDTIEQKQMLIRVVVQQQGDDLIVVSAYKTSKIRKYWLEVS